MVKWNDESGFTLVEMAIVLVIIGIILGMVIKGRSLVTTAKVKKTAAQVRQLETWAWNFYSRYNRFPGDCDQNKVIDAQATRTASIDDSPATGFCSGNSADTDQDRPYAELKEAKIAPSMDNSKLAETPLGGGYVYLGYVYSYRTRENYNAIVISRCTCMEAKDLDSSIDGELDAGDGRVRVLTGNGRFLERPDTPWDGYCRNGEYTRVSVVYLFDQTP